MRRKILFAVLIAVLTAVVMGGCGNKKGDEKPVAETPVPTLTSALTFTPAPTDTPKPTDTPTPTNTPKPTSTPVPTNTPEPTATPVITVDISTLKMEEYPITAENVKLLGRSFSHGDIRWFSYSASGIEFTYENADAVVIKLVGDSMAGNSSSANHQTKYSVFLNGTEYETALLDTKEKDVVVITAGTENGVIRVNKCSESSDSTFGIKSVALNGRIAPTAEKDLNIQFIGDSITCGYGVDGVYGDVYCTENENGLKTYAFKAAEKLDADYTMVSFSGYGVVSGYTGGDKPNTASLLPKYYDKVGNSYGTILGSINPNKVEWDFSNDHFDYIVVNLGTNDNSYVKGSPDKTEEFKKAYDLFVRQIREKNPDSHIICSLGIMGQELYKAIEETVTAYSAESGDTNISCLKFAVQNVNVDGKTVDWHPTEKTHEKASDKLAAYIKSLEEGKE